MDILKPLLFLQLLYKLLTVHVGHVLVQDDNSWMFLLGLREPLQTVSGFLSRAIPAWLSLSAMTDRIV